jgi:hypothetical protein
MVSKQVVHARIGFSFQLAVTYIAHDTDDLVPVVDAASGNRSAVDAFADRVLRPEVVAREGFVDDRDVRPALRSSFATPRPRSRGMPIASK